MTTVFIDHRNADIDIDGDRLVVRAGGERKGTVPLRLVERIVVFGTARLTTRFVTRLRALGIGLCVIGSAFREPPVTIVAAGADAALRLAQYDLAGDPAARLALARPLVAAKITGEAELLGRLIARRRGDPRLLAAARGQLLDALDRLREGSGIPHLAALMGREGAAAAAYFAAFATAFAPALRFAGRNRRPPRDPVNVCLSLGYTLMQFEALCAAVRHGLDPLIGVYHDLKPGRDSLACDLVEPVRSAIDRFVHDLFADTALRPEDFTGGGAAGCKLGKAGRDAFYRAYDETAAAALRERVDGEASALAAAIRARGAPRMAALVEAEALAPAGPPLLFRDAKDRR